MNPKLVIHHDCYVHDQLPSRKSIEITMGRNTVMFLPTIYLGQHILEMNERALIKAVRS